MEVVNCQQRGSRLRTRARSITQVFASVNDTQNLPLRSGATRHLLSPLFTMRARGETRKHPFATSQNAALRRSAAHTCAGGIQILAARDKNYAMAQSRSGGYP